MHPLLFDLIALEIDEAYWHGTDFALPQQLVCVPDSLTFQPLFDFIQLSSVRGNGCSVRLTVSVLLSQKCEWKGMELDTDQMSVGAFPYTTALSILTFLFPVH